MEVCECKQDSRGVGKRGAKERVRVDASRWTTCTLYKAKPGARRCALEEEEGVWDSKEP